MSDVAWPKVRESMRGSVTGQSSSWDDSDNPGGKTGKRGSITSNTSRDADDDITDKDEPPKEEGPAKPKQVANAKKRHWG